MSTDTNTSPIEDALAARMIALADALAPLVNDACAIHYDLGQRGEWGTGVTASMERRLEKVERDLRDLVRLSVEAGQIKYYVEYRNGNCSVIQASSEEIAREEAQDFVRAFQSGGVTVFRVATVDDLRSFSGAIYKVA